MSGLCDFCHVWHSGSCCHPGRAELTRLRGEVLAAERRVRQLEGERVVLAMFSSDTPMFTNPLHVVRAKALRDSVLDAAGEFPAPTTDTQVQPPTGAEGGRDG